MDILTPFQSAFLKAFSQSPLNDRFYLTGGTALAAFYLQHRLSEDLDFFTADSAAVRDVPDAMERLAQALHCRLRVERSLPSFFDGDIIPNEGPPVKIDFRI